MRIHKEGYRIILTALVAMLVLNSVIVVLAGFGIVSILLLTASLVFFGLVVQFFRNPVRTTPYSEFSVICPADGKVVVIEEVEEPEYFRDMRKQVSIFMSPLNVHVNRYPIEGEVKYQKYYPGKYLVAWHPKSSTENERTTVVVEGSKGSVLFRQIAGAVARRIICYAKPGDKAAQGADFGFIRFGSRVDIFLPLDCKVNVKLNQVVRGGETVLATFS